MTTEDVFLKYGLPGAFIVILLMAIRWFANYLKEINKKHEEERERLEQLHRQERDDWKRTIERQFDESNKSNRETASILSSVKTLLESRK